MIILINLGISLIHLIIITIIFSIIEKYRSNVYLMLYYNISL